MINLERTKMKNRLSITAADLYVLLQREFRRRQVPACSSCYVQLPFRVDQPSPEGANWEVIIPTECSYGCREVMDEVIEQFSGRYNLLPEASR
jgi:hypothetical protein